MPFVICVCMTGVNAFRHQCLYVCCECFSSVCLYFHSPLFSKKRNVTQLHLPLRQQPQFRMATFDPEEDGVYTVEYWWIGMPSSLMFSKVGLFISLPCLALTPPPPPRSPSCLYLRLTFSFCSRLSVITVTLVTAEFRRPFWSYDVIRLLRNEIIQIKVILNTV